MWLLYNQYNLHANSVFVIILLLIKKNRIELRSWDLCKDFPLFFTKKCIYELTTEM